jgi:restriction endonuclease Mrr
VLSAFGEIKQIAASPLRVRHDPDARSQPRCAPKATLAEIVEKLNNEINAGLADPKIKARLADLGGAVLALSPSNFEKLIADGTEKWAKVIKFMGYGRHQTGVSPLSMRR